MVGWGVGVGVGSPLQVRSGVRGGRRPEAAHGSMMLDGTRDFADCFSSLRHDSDYINDTNAHMNRADLCATILHCIANNTQDPSHLSTSADARGRSARARQLAHTAARHTALSIHASHAT